ncbi:hypothetical protein [Oceanobacillus alkalisoli]|uniref:hypothetical protein n=1 Tax=Oceanobacillus alkalisoli TaxID=2925113 RepID=UPI001F11D080|nr:hypothetical protein [Oceanobacillus alkalisoli]MCF3942744.1 hypothetical protein [Oceanobacillus alkalisoli]
MLPKEVSLYRSVTGCKFSTSRYGRNFLYLNEFHNYQSRLFHGEALNTYYEIH